METGLETLRTHGFSAISNCGSALFVVSQYLVDPFL
jgi:hypothetical protein